MKNNLALMKTEMKCKLLRVLVLKCFRKAFPLPHLHGEVIISFDTLFK